MNERPGLGLDLVEIIAMNIEALVGEESKNRFLNNDTIKYAIDKPEPIQRITINRFFNAELLKFRAHNDIDVNDVMFLLINDGDVKEWIKIMKHITIPFCKEHNII